MALREELNNFWIWFRATPEQYSRSSQNGEVEIEYPGWSDLISSTEEAIEELNKSFDQELAELVIQALAIDNEAEQIQQQLESTLVPIQEFSQQVISSSQGHARWQLAEILKSKSRDIAAPLLTRMIRADPDPYVQRRALLSLDQVNHVLAVAQAKHFTHSEDPILKRIALDILNN